MASKNDDSSHPNDKEEIITNTKPTEFEIEILPDKEIRIRRKGMLVKKLLIPRNTNTNDQEGIES